MAATSVKIDNDIYQQVIDHTQNNGGKIGKFFEIAAKEKLAREGTPTLDRQDSWPIKKETKCYLNSVGFGEAPHSTCKTVCVPKRD